jgi:predicted transcriptional regulator
MANFAGQLSMYLPHPRKNRMYSDAFHKKYRSHFEIIALMLEAAKNRGAAKFSIMKHSSVNCRQLNKYLESLTEMGFVEIELGKNQILYRASEKGLHFLRHYYVLQSMLLGTVASQLEKAIPPSNYSQDLMREVCHTPLNEGR